MWLSKNNLFFLDIVALKSDFRRNVTKSGKFYWRSRSISLPYSLLPIFKFNNNVYCSLKRAFWLVVDQDQQRLHSYRNDFLATRKAFSAK